jgi:hypothetical protein
MNDIMALRRALQYATTRLITRDVGRWSATGEDRRRVPRFSYSAEGTATVVCRTTGHTFDGSPEFPVIMLDLSRAGLGFLANEELREGDTVEVSLPAGQGDSKATKRLIATVMRCKRAGLNAFEIGCQFTAMKD